MRTGIEGIDAFKRQAAPTGGSQLFNRLLPGKLASNMAGKNILLAWIGHPGKL
jgi:hypothetical protein